MIHLRLPTTLDRIVAIGRAEPALPRSAVDFATDICGRRDVAEATQRHLARRRPAIRPHPIDAASMLLLTAFWVADGVLLELAAMIGWAWWIGSDLLRHKRRRDQLERNAMNWIALAARLDLEPDVCIELSAS